MPVVPEDGYELTASYEIAGEERWHAHDATAADANLATELQCARDDARLYVHHPLAVALEVSPLELATRLADDVEIVSGELCGMARRRTTTQVVRARVESVDAVAEPNRRVLVVVLERTRAECDVDRGRPEIDALYGKMQLDVDLRMCARVTLDEWRQEPIGEHRRCRDPKRAVCPHGLPGQLAEHGLCSIDDRDDTREVVVRDVREEQAFGAATQELHAELTLER